MEEILVGSFNWQAVVDVGRLLVITLGFSVVWGLIIYLLFQAWRNRGRRQQAVQSVTLLVRLPKDNEVKIEAAEQMFTAIHALQLTRFEEMVKRPPLFTIEVVAKKEDIAFYINLPVELRDLIEKNVHAAYPEADISPVVDQSIWTKNGQVACGRLRLSNTRFPLKTYKELVNDGLQGLTSAVSKMGADEGAIVQFLIQPVSDKFRDQTLKIIQKRQDDSTEGKAKYESELKESQAMEAKVEKPLFAVDIRVCVNSPSKVAAASHLKNIEASFAQFSTPYTSFESAPTVSKKTFMMNFIYRYPPYWGNKSLSVLNTEELASIIHFPNRAVETHHLRFLYAKNAPAPREIPESGLFLGKSIYRGEVRNIYMSLPDRRRHMYIVGKTGVGKSEFLKEMVIQDVENGYGVCAIDPHGEFVEDLLQMIPPERAEDVIYFNPSDLARPLGMNIMEADTEEQRQFVVGSVIGLMYKLYDPHRTGIIGPRFEHAIRNVMLTIMYRPGSTFIEMVRAITDEKFVEDILPMIEDPMVKRYWTDQMAQTSDFHKSEVLDYIVSKFGRFVTNKTMRNIIGQPVSAFNFRQAMDQKKIILCNLSKGILGEEDAKFLGLILVPKVLTAAMSRQDIPMDQREDFFLYVDEFQNYATEDFATILSEARKYRLNLVVANQYIAQIDDDVRNAVFGNVGTIVSFRVGVNDAQYLQHEFAPVFSETDLTNIEKYHVYMKTIVNNEPVPPFSVSLEKDMAAAQARMNPELAEMIKQLSRLKYGRDREEIEQEMNERARLL